jgi:hypothetical protein
MTTYNTNNKTTNNTSSEKKEYPPFVNAKDLFDHNITFTIRNIKTIDFNYQSGKTVKWVLNITYTHPRFNRPQDATLTFYYYRKSGKPNTVLCDIFDPLTTDVFPIKDAKIVEHTLTWKQDGEQRSFTELVPQFKVEYPESHTNPLDTLELEDHPF